MSNLECGRWLKANDHLFRPYLHKNVTISLRSSASMVMIYMSIECGNDSFEGQIMKN